MSPSHTHTRTPSTCTDTITGVAVDGADEDLTAAAAAAAESAAAAKIADDNKGKLFIGGLSWETTQEGLSGYFSKFGEVTDCVVMINPHTRRSRGFGFITFADADIAAQVIASGKHSLDSRDIDPKPAVPKGGGGPRTNRMGGPGGQGHARNNGGPRRDQSSVPAVAIKTKKIFVGGLTPDTTQDSLKAFFSEFGTVEDVILMYDRETRRPRGFGFVSFSSEDPVDALVAKRFVEIAKKSVEIKAAMPKSSIEGGVRGQRNPRAGGRGQQYPYGYGAGAGEYGNQQMMNQQFFNRQYQQQVQYANQQGYGGQMGGAGGRQQYSGAEGQQQQQYYEYSQQQRGGGPGYAAGAAATEGSGSQQSASYSSGGAGAGAQQGSSGQQSGFYSGYQAGGYGSQGAQGRSGQPYQQMAAGGYASMYMSSSGSGEFEGAGAGDATAS
jgi:RNA-binding protein Musashi